MTKKEAKKAGKFTTVSIPVQLFEKIKKRIEGTGFTSVSDYVTYVLREVLASLEEEEKEKPFSREEEEKVKELIKQNKGEELSKVEDEDEALVDEKTAAIIKKFKHKILREFIPHFMLN